MQEQIYTIPVNEAYDTPCECPLCLLERKLEDEAVDYALGAAMMEPDYRIKSNEKGFCNRHLSQMFERQNKLSLALVLETHLEEVRNTIDNYKKSAESLASGKSSLFKKSDAKEICSKLSADLKKVNSSCVICDQIDNTMQRYVNVIFYMWKKDDEFKTKFKNSKGLCLKHFEILLEAAQKNLHGQTLSDFTSIIILKQISELERIQNDIHKFTLKFDYRNKDMEWGTAEDAPLRTTEKLSGFLHQQN